MNALFHLDIFLKVSYTLLLAYFTADKLLYFAPEIVLFLFVKYAFVIFKCDVHLAHFFWGTSIFVLKFVDFSWREFLGKVHDWYIKLCWPLFEISLL